MQQKSSRVFLCSLGLPNHFSLQGVFCERVLRPTFENEPIFKLHLHTSGLSSVNTSAEPVPCGLEQGLDTGSWQERTESRSGTGGQVVSAGDSALWT